MIRNFFEGFISSFGNSEAISPEEWNTRTLFLNMVLAIVIAIIFSLLSAIALVILQGLTSISISGGLFWTIILSVGIVSALSKIQGKAIYFEVPQGHYGIITVMERKIGSLTKPYRLGEGKFRQVSPIPFFDFGNTFGAITVPRKLAPMEFEYHENKTKDGIALHGTHAMLPGIYDPWVFTDFFLSVGGIDGVRSFLQELSLSVMDTTFDEFNIDDIFKNKDGSNKVKNNYYENLEAHARCLDVQNDFWTGNDVPSRNDSKIDADRKDTFAISGTGLNIQFLIKTVQAPAGVAEGYNNINVAKNTADAEALKQRKLRDVYNGIVKSLRKNNHEQPAAQHVATLIMDLYSEEKLVSLGGPDGETLGNEIQQLIAGYFNRANRN